MKKLLLFFSFLLLFILFLSLRKTTLAQYICDTYADCPCGDGCNGLHHCVAGLIPHTDCTPTPTPKVGPQPATNTPIPGTPVATETPPPCPYSICQCGTTQDDDGIWGCWCARGCWQWTCANPNSCTEEEAISCSNWAPGCPFQSCINCAGNPSVPTDVPGAPDQPSLYCSANVTAGATCSCTSDTTPVWNWTLPAGSLTATNFALDTPSGSGIDGLAAPVPKNCSNIASVCTFNGTSGHFNPTALADGSYELQVAGRRSGVQGLYSNPVTANIDNTSPLDLDAAKFIATVNNGDCAGTSPSITFSWTPQPEEVTDCLTTYYQLQVSTKDDGFADTSAFVVNEESLLSSPYEFKTPINGTTYYARLRSVEKEGNPPVIVHSSNWITLSGGGTSIEGVNCPWYKLKNSSYHKSITLTVPIPASPGSFDGDDTDPINGIGFFDIGAAGLVSGGSDITINSISANGWAINNYTRTNLLTPAYFLEYVRSRKEYVTIDNLANLVGSKINYLDTPSLTISNGSVFSGKTPLVLIVTGNISIEQNIPEDTSVAIIALGEIGIKSSVNSIGGIFIASSVDFASDFVTPDSTATPLKIDGNIIAVNNGQTDRERSRTDDLSKPSIFVVVDPIKYVNLLPYLSTANYEWKQVQ